MMKFPRAGARAAERAALSRSTHLSTMLGRLSTREVTLPADEGIRPDTTVEAISKIKPALPGGVVAAGNASQYIGLWELNEAFAVQVIYYRDRLGIPGRSSEGERRRDRDWPSLRDVWRAPRRPCPDRGQAPEGEACRRHHVRGRWEWGQRAFSRSLER